MKSFSIMAEGVAAAKFVLGEVFVKGLHLPLVRIDLTLGPIVPSTPFPHLLWYFQVSY